MNELLLFCDSNCCTLYANKSELTASSYTPRRCLALLDRRERATEKDHHPYHTGTNKGKGPSHFPNRTLKNINRVNNHALKIKQKKDVFTTTIQSLLVSLRDGGETPRSTGARRSI